MRAAVVALGLILGAGALIGGAFVIDNTPQSGNKSDREKRNDPLALACIAAQEAVKERLRNPSAAKFQSCLYRPRFVQSDASDLNFTVRSFFGSFDESGILRSHSYVVSVQRDPASRQWLSTVLEIQ